MITDYFRNTVIHKNGRKTKTVEQNQNNQLPNWLTLQTIISVITLIGMVTGFFVQNAILTERAERLKIDFEAYKTQTTSAFDKLGQQIEQMKLENARQQGMREAEANKKK